MSLATALHCPSEFMAINEWWWTASCEYADLVFPVDSWAELRCPDMTISVTNPFLYVFPATTLPRIHDTRSDVEVAAGVCNALGKLLNDEEVYNNIRDASILAKDLFYTLKMDPSKLLFRPKQ